MTTTFKPSPVLLPIYVGPKPQPRPYSTAVATLDPQVIMDDEVTDPTVHVPTNLTAMRQALPFHPYHLTALSPWPILMAMAVFGTLASFAMWFNGVIGSGTGTLLGATAALTVLISWFRDVSKEATLMGLHTRVVSQGHVLGFALFVTTEAMFFASIFWAFFHSALAPTVELGGTWPPVGIEAISPMLVPLLNTTLLMSSGATVTYAHHAFFHGGRGAAVLGLLATLVLAVVFTALQAYEYDVSAFTIADGAFGSCFYFSTGTHGLHVLVGTLFLAVGFGRLVTYAFTREHHTGLEAAILYWHFVDVVWVFLYVVVYGWTAAGA